MKRFLVLTSALVAFPVASHAQSVVCGPPPNWVGIWSSYTATGNPADLKTSTTVGETIGQAVKASGGMAANLTACNPQLQGGSASGLSQTGSTLDSTSRLNGTNVSQAMSTVLGAKIGRYLSAKLLDVVSVRDFGAAGDGKTDDVAAINAAIAYAKTTSYSGGRIWFPDGVYNISAPVILTGSGFSLVGSSPKAVTIRATYTSGNIVQVGQAGTSLDNENDGVSGLNITASSPMTSGTALYADGVYNLRVSDVRIATNVYDGIDIEGSIGTTYGVYLSRWWVSGVLNRGIVVGATASSQATVATDVFLSEGMILPGQSAADCGICLYGSGGFYASGVDITNTGGARFNNGIKIAPGSSTDVNAVLLSRVLADSSNNENILFSGSGIIADVTITNGWANTSKTGSGIVFNNPLTDGVTVAASVIDTNAQSGVVINAGQNIAIQSDRILNNSMSSSGNYDGVVVAAGVSHFSITDDMIGNGGWFNQSGHGDIHQRWGVNIVAGASNGYIVTNNRGMNNVSGIVNDGGTGTSKTVSGNIPN